VNVYTAEEVAVMLKLDYKTVLRLIKRGLLKALPGIRHKRITEEELNRYLDVRGILGSSASTTSVLHTSPGQTCVHATGRSTRLSNGHGVSKGPIVVTSTAKGVASSIAPVKPKENK
jgi:excisionase family DNA binding protein